MRRATTRSSHGDSDDGEKQQEEDAAAKHVSHFGRTIAWAACRSKTARPQLSEHGGQAKRELFEYTEAFYNTRRRHSTLDYISPAEFERFRSGCGEEH